MEENQNLLLLTQLLAKEVFFFQFDLKLHVEKVWLDLTDKNLSDLIITCSRHTLFALMNFKECEEQKQREGSQLVLENQPTSFSSKDSFFSSPHFRSI